jgi:hypothetical protein
VRRGLKKLESGESVAVVGADESRCAAKGVPLGLGVGNDDLLEFTRLPCKDTADCSAPRGTGGLEAVVTVEMLTDCSEDCRPGGIEGFLDVMAVTLPA